MSELSIATHVTGRGRGRRMIWWNSNIYNSDFEDDLTGAGGIESPPVDPTNPTVVFSNPIRSPDVTITPYASDSDEDKMEVEIDSRTVDDNDSNITKIL